MAARDKAQSEDVILAFLTGAFARERLRACCVRDRVQADSAIECAQEEAQKSLHLFIQALESAGWSLSDLPIDVGDIQYPNTM